MSQNFKFVALDTNVFIYYFEGDKTFGKKAKLIFDQLTEKRLKAVVNITALAEILSSPNLHEKAVKETKKLFLSVPSLEIYHVDENITLESTRIRRKYNFRLFDAIQLATAIIAHADVFITNDKKLLRCKEIKVLLLSSFA